MPLNNSYDEQAVIQAIASALETFYGTLIEKIDGLNIQKVMKRKNPYLYRAKAMQSATEIVDSVLTAFVSSSEETIFGNCFFEPIAIAATATVYEGVSKAVCFAMKASSVEDMEDCLNDSGWKVPIVADYLTRGNKKNGGKN